MILSQPYKTHFYWRCAFYICCRWILWGKKLTWQMQNIDNIQLISTRNSSSAWKKMSVPWCNQKSIHNVWSHILKSKSFNYWCSQKNKVFQWLFCFTWQYWKFIRRVERIPCIFNARFLFWFSSSLVLIYGRKRGGMWTLYIDVWVKWYNWQLNN